MKKIKIKVCGMRDPENIRQVTALDVDIIGFIFYPGSPRYVITNRMAATGAAVASKEVPVSKDIFADVVHCCLKDKAGVFVNESVSGILNIAELYGFDYLQLHGDESPGYCEALRRRGYAIIKVFPVASAGDLVRIADYRDVVDYLLFDTKCTHYGGSGKRFDWAILDEYKENVPFLLSGGLTADSAYDINLLARHPAFAGIDLNSGFEVSPALKDIGRLKAFVDVIRCT